MACLAFRTLASPLLKPPTNLSDNYSNYNKTNLVMLRVHDEYYMITRRKYVSTPKGPWYTFMWPLD